MTFCRHLLATLVVGLALAASAMATQTRMPLRGVGFVTNAGQWPSHVLYAVRQPGAVVWITTTGVTVQDASVTELDVHGTVSQQTLLVNGRAVQLRPVNGAAVSTATYFTPEHPAGITVPAYDRVVFPNVAPGVTVQYALTADGRVERTIASVSSEARAALTIASDRGDDTRAIQATPPTSFVYGAYIGGSEFDVVAGIEMLNNGDVVIAGSTLGLSYPETLGTYRKTKYGLLDAFVMRCDAQLTRVLGYTYYGGSGDDRVRTMSKADANGIVIVGETRSNDLPTVTSATGKTYRGALDAFVASFDSTLTKLRTGFYHGGNNDDIPRGVDVDQYGTIVICGSTLSTTGMTVTAPATSTLTWTYREGNRTRTATVNLTSGRTLAGQTDGFVATFNAGGAIQQSRYYGKPGMEYFNSVGFDGLGRIILTGMTNATDFEAVPAYATTWDGRLPYDRTYNGGASDAFVIRFNASMAFSQTDDDSFATLLGGNRDDEGVFVKVDDKGKIHIVGATTSTNMPTEGSFSATNLGRKDAFYAVLGVDGGSLSGCAYVGGSGDDSPYAARLSETSSNITIAGTTTSLDYPIVGDGAIDAVQGPTDGFVTTVNLGSIVTSTRVTGLLADTVVGVQLNKYGYPFYAANTTSADLRTHDSTFGKASSGPKGYIGKIAYGTIDLTLPVEGNVLCIDKTYPVTWAINGVNDTVRYRVQFAPFGKDTWTDLAKSVLGRNYQWKIPKIALGEYVVRVTTMHGHETKLLAPFVISDKPTIVRQPANASACVGQPLALSIDATGPGLTYQWRKAGTAITGATQPTFSITAVDASSSGSYDCIVTGTCAPAVTSTAATVSVATQTAITTQPSNVSVEEKKGFTLTVLASGSNLTYLWKKNGEAITGATAASYAVASAAKSDEGAYVCDVTGGCGAITTAVAQVVVTPTTSVYDDVPVTGALASIIGPQPAAASVYIKVNLGATSDVVLSVLDLQGRRVAQTLAGSLVAGVHILPVDLAACASGVHRLEISAGAQRITLPITVAR
jgi:hypothetical protein